MAHPNKWKIDKDGFHFQELIVFSAIYSTQLLSQQSKCERKNTVISTRATQLI